MAWDGRSDPPQGAVQVVSLSAATTGTASITFDPPYSGIPSVQLTVTNGATVYFPYVVSVSATGATIGVRRYNDVSSTANVSVRWDSRI